MPVNLAARMIRYPFPKGESPYRRRLGEWAERCILGDYRGLPARCRELALRTNYGDVTGYYYPDASLGKAIPICRWMIYVGSYDDSFGTRGEKVLREMNARVDAVFRGGRLMPGDTGLGREFLRQVERIMREFRPFATPEWEGRFAENNRRYLDALITDSGYSYREVVRYPSLEEYFRIRENIVAVHPCSNMAEIVAGCILPGELVEHRVMRRIHRVTALLMAFCNDCFSAEKERRDREAMNLVLVLEHERGYGFGEACGEAARIHDALVVEFAALRRSLPDFGRWNRPLQRYLDTLELMIHGNLLWHLTTTRHRVQKGAERGLS